MFHPDHTLVAFAVEMLEDVLVMQERLHGARMGVLSNAFAAASSTKRSFSWSQFSFAGVGVL
jgi:hypothetical protein